MKNCVICGRFLKKGRERCCSRRCVGKIYGNSVIGKGEKTPYIMIRVEKKLTLLHRHVWEQANKRKLRAGEIVHHKNGDKRDNRPQNLQVIPNQAAHLRLHNYFIEEKRLARKKRRAAYQRHFSELGW